jgi:hypothetical protein
MRRERSSEKKSGGRNGKEVKEKKQVKEGRRAGKE